MRDIKFRAWNRIVMRMHLFSLHDIERQKENIQWQNLEVMQFTGLKDKSGKDIYEDDIVIIYPPEFSKDEPIKYIVYYGSWCYMKKKRMESTGYGFDAIEARSRAEVIGNIYESPKLLNIDLKPEGCDTTGDQESGAAD